jgi:nicotinamidase-related amidase
MSIQAVILILPAVIAALAAAGLIMLVRSMFMATKGRRIAAYPKPGRALVVLDIQEGYAGTGPGQPVTAPPAGSLIGTVNRVIEKAALTGMEVAYFRQVFGSSLLVRLHGGKRRGRVVIDRRVKVINDNDFEKNRTDAFSNRRFEQFLVDRQVNELYLAGVDAAYCVYYTALGALNRGYKVTVITDAVRSRKDMAKVLEMYRRKGIALTTSVQLTQTADGGSVTVFPAAGTS